MRAKIIILLITLAYAQVTAAQISLDVRNERLSAVLSKIEKQTGGQYDFFYPSDYMASSKPVTLKLKNVPLEDALKQCFANQPFNYSIKDKTIVVTIKKATATPAVPPKENKQEQIPIKGKVTDQKTGSPLPGVTIRIKGSNTGTVTDANGNYTIDADPADVIIFTFVGYRTFEIKVNAQSTIDMVMVENQATLNETVVKGYYTTTKELNTGNVSTVKAEEIARQPVGDPMAALISRVPGLSVQQSSGVNGRTFIVRLRGQNSLDNGKDPLFIVDGVQYNSDPISKSTSVYTAGGYASPFNYLNPEDIESIDVLKDADATAIYGSRGANGVILITTKKAKAGQLQLDARYYKGFSKAPLRVDFMNTQEYLAMRRAAFANDNKQPAAGDYDLNGTWDTTRYTDWQKYFIGGSAPVDDAFIGVTMGSATTSFRIGAGYRSEGTIYPGDFKSNRSNVNVSVNHSALQNRLNVLFSASYGYSENNLPINESEKNIVRAPNAPAIYNADGTLNWANDSWENPIAFFNQSALEKAKTLISNLTVSYKIWKDLAFKTSFGYTTTNFRQRNLRPWSAVNPSTPVNPADIRRHAMVNAENRNLTIEPQITYNKNLFGGDIGLLAGGTFQESLNDSYDIAATGFPSDGLMENLAAATTFGDVRRSSSKYKYSALFARAGYTYRSRYVLNLTARRDGSSRFGPSKRFGNFGAVGAAWIFSNEEFLRNKSALLSFGKLRFSYGSTGNEQLGDYKYLDTYSIYTLAYQGNTSLTPTQLTNPFYGWERVNKLEGGIELGLINDRINLTSSYYRNRTKNQLVQVPLPTTTGFATVRANLPAVIQNSGFEVEIRSVNIEKRNFSWTTAFNLTIPKNNLISFPGIESSTYARRFIVGQPINSLVFVYRYTGLDPNTGLYTFDDLNKDGNFTNTQDQVPIFFGQKYFGGLSNRLTIGQFEFDFHFQFTKQNGYGYTYNAGSGFFNGGLGNQMRYTGAVDRQKLSASNANNAVLGSLFQSSDAMIIDASFIRLKNVGLYYNLRSFAKGIPKSRIFLQGQNLATITNYIGFDPESPTMSAIVPPLRTVVAGIQLTL